MPKEWTRSHHDWTETVATLGARFAERAAVHDTDDSFVAESYADLAQARFFSAAVPVEHGGGGATHSEICAALRRMAHDCPSTALCVSMHQHLLAAVLWRRRQGEDVEKLLWRTAAEELVLVSTGATDWLHSEGEMTKVEGGYRVSAQKRFASGPPPAGTCW